MNKVILEGFLGQDPEVRMTSGGSMISIFRVATTERWEKDGKQHERTEWHTVNLWGEEHSDLVKSCSKGDLVHVEGSIRTESYEDRDGKKRYVTKINAKSVVKKKKEEDFG